MRPQHEPQSELEEVEAKTPLRRQRRGIIVVLVAVVAGIGLLVTGWLAAGAFQSPAQIAAAASPPPASQVTAAVTLGDLRDQINMESTVVRERSQDIALPAREGATVITKTPLPPGSAVSAGALVLEVNGEPVFSLPGTFPLYRDLAIGDSGADVRLLQAGLREAGFSSVTVDGVLGSSTRGAVEKLYRNAGYRAPSTGVASLAPPAADTKTDEAKTDQSAPATAADPIVVVKSSAFIVFSSAPAFLTSAPQVGAVAEEEAFVTLASGTPLSVATVTASTAASLAVDMPAVAPLSDGTTVDLVVSAIGKPTEDGSVDVTLRSAAAPIPDELIGTSFVISVTRQLVAEGALIVPTRAISSRGNDDQIVLRRNDDGFFSEVRVRETAALGGRSAIELTGEEAELEPGDEVMVQ